jgi:hypothetical protein
VTLAGRAGGIRVEVDDSRCVVLRQHRLSGRDVVLTVTDVEGLRQALADAVTLIATLDELDRADWEGT